MSGRELVQQGVDQITRGVVGTLVQEVKVGGRMAVVGAGLGFLSGALDSRQSALSSAWHGATTGGAIGLFLGWETAVLKDNEKAREQGLPTATFSDWLIANLLFYSADAGNIGIVRSLLINAETVAGAKKILRGAWRNIWS